VNEDEVTRAALNMRDEARRFRDPVESYVNEEAAVRWKRDNPDGDFYTDVDLSEDWELKSWKILARAALAARLPDREGLIYVLRQFAKFASHVDGPKALIHEEWPVTVADAIKARDLLADLEQGAKS
jgi:hypothetical protein